ncbi:type II secretion system secretin GspD [Candidatus Nitrosoglobus terrae]|nr:type II secretion system secretin GspD [Candidatus Nitrosoglobus terrae]
MNWLVAVCFLTLSACINQTPRTEDQQQSEPLETSSSDSDQQSLAPQQEQEQEQDKDKAIATEVKLKDKEKKKAKPPELYPGSNHFIDLKAAGKSPAFEVVKGAILLNFENTNLREVVKTILGDILGENYLIDPAVQGTVTVQTGRPLPKEVLVPTLENLLRMNNAALVQSKGLYKVVLTSQALQGNLSPHLKAAQATPGYGVRIIPLHYIGAAEMEKILTPFVPKEAFILVDPNRNLIMLAGIAQELDQWQETVDVFDVNWLKGMSVGLYRLQNTEAGTVATELDGIFGAESDTPLAGMFRFVPVERLNGILVITSQSKYLDEVKTWIDRLDLDEDIESEHFYVYQVQNGKAEYLADLLQSAFGQESSASSSGKVAPGQRSSQLFSSPGGRGGMGSMSGSGGFGSSSFGSGGFGSSSGGMGGSMGGSMGGRTGGGFLASQEVDPNAATQESATAPDKSTQKTDPNQPAQALNLQISQAESKGNKGKEKSGVGKKIKSLLGGTKSSDSEEPEVRIIPDEANNSLLIATTPPTYDKIRAILRHLDIAPRQVLIEATIAEVTLTGALQYGVQWFFKNGIGKAGNNNFSGTGTINTGGASPLTAAAASAAKALGSSNFSYALTSGGAINALLTAAASESKLNVLSSPQLMVLDNQMAEIQVGDQVPILSGQTAGVGGIGTGVLTSQVQYKNTGVMLTVIPRVNAGGRVTLELKQEVTDQGSAVTVGNISNFTFLQRAFQSVVTVQSGNTIILGGLIRTNDTFNSNGVPFLYKLPLVGSLFGSRNTTKNRTELIVLMTPRVVRDQTEARLVTEEFRQKLNNASNIANQEATMEDEGGDPYYSNIESQPLK